MHEPSPGEVHAALLLALAPERDGDVANAHRLGDARAPRRLELLPHDGLAAAGLARDHDALDAAARQVETACGAQLGQVHA